MAYFQNVVHIHAISSVFLLVGLLIATTMIQQRCNIRIEEVLSKVSNRVKETESYKCAQRYFQRRSVPNLFTSSAHWLPVWFLIIVVLVCSVVSYFGAEFFAASNFSTEKPMTPSYVLGGVSVLQDSTAVLWRYQSSTVFIGSMAFLGAYCWVIAQLMNRINNSDMNPISYYFLSIRILTACLVAGLARHMVEAIPVDGVIGPPDNPVGLAVLGFLIGWNPTLWINELLIKASDLVKSQIPSQRWPARPNLPLNLTLLMVQGMVVDKMERLMELNIDNCQKLANENPLVLWVRTSFALELIVDWIAQARLCIQFEDDKLAVLRNNGIRDVFQYIETINDPAGLAAVQAIIGISPDIIASHKRSIASDSTFQMLVELRRALQVDKCPVCGLTPPLQPVGSEQEEKAA
jgi:hypothetical protein